LYANKLETTWNEHIPTLTQNDIKNLNIAVTKTEFVIKKLHSKKSPGHTAGKFYQMLKEELFTNSSHLPKT
jgi:hypothetical protein